MRAPGRVVHVSRLLVRLVGFAMAALVAFGDPRRATGPERGFPLIVRAAPQDGYVFLAWNSVPGAATYRVQWRRADRTGWVSSEDAGGVVRLAVGPLDNGADYRFRVVADGPTPVVSNVVGAAPFGTSVPAYGGQDCAWETGSRRQELGGVEAFFCTQAAAATWLTQSGFTDPALLRCRGAPLPIWGASSPDCHYSYGDRVSFVLARQLRGGDARFRTPDDPPRPEDVTRVARRLIWPGNNPFDDPTDYPVDLTSTSPPDVGEVVGYASAESFTVRYSPQLASRITRFVPPNWVRGLTAIYHEGHGLSALTTSSGTGAATISWLLARGWETYAMDMPLVGRNAADVAPPSLVDHFGLRVFDVPPSSSLTAFLLPVRAVVDRIYARRATGQPGTVLLIGRSGGGWTAYTYAALDPRVDLAVNVSGGLPSPQRWASVFGSPDVGDYEQYAPYLYSVVGHEDLMGAAGARGSMHIYSEHDTCCYEVTGRGGDADFLAYLEAYGTRFGKDIAVFVDHKFSAHGIGPDGYAALDSYLARTAVPRMAPTPTTVAPPP